MKSRNSRKKADSMWDEYPAELIRQGVRGKYAKRMQAGYSIIVTPSKSRTAKKAKNKQTSEVSKPTRLFIAVGREANGRWLAEVTRLPGVMAYGRTRSDAIIRAKALALRVIADRLEHGEEVPELPEVFSVVA